jgi:ABC-type sugar transport system substrate-binding protein
MKNKTNSLMALTTAVSFALTALAAADRTATIGWEADSTATSFIVKVGDAVAATVETNEATFVIPDTATSITVVAVNAGGESEPSATLVIPAAPLNPKGVYVKSIVRVTTTTTTSVKR